jgi:ParB family chromosome partitioning protein
MDYIVDNIYSSDSNEWYTPVEYIRAVRAVLGTIDLDPASCALANTVVQAITYYSLEDDGLNKPWSGHVYINPPYGRVGTDRQKGQTELWIQRLIQEFNDGTVTEAILLVNAYLYKQWFAPLWQYPICFPSGRISFWNAQGKSGRSPHSSAFVYFGNDTQKFVDVFCVFGDGIVQALKSSPVEQIPTIWDEELYTSISG